MKLTLDELTLAITAITIALRVDPTTKRKAALQALSSKLKAEAVLRYRSGERYIP